MTQPEKAAAFRAMHQSGRILVLPNAWDVASAVIFERVGFPSVATSSAGVAFSLGYPDGQQIKPEEMLAVIGRIARALQVPVTADVEAGYDDPVRTAAQVMESGAVGLNLEDWLNPPDLVPLERQIALIKAVRSSTNLVINARTDVFLQQIGDPKTRFDRTVERLNAYLDAGADSAFAPGVTDAATIGRLAQAVRGPLNVLAGAGTPPTAELQRLGVARVSIGSAPMRATLGRLRHIASELKQQGTYTALLEESIGYAEINEMLAGRLL